MILKKYYCKTNLYGLKLKKLFLIWTLIKVILFLNLINEISFTCLSRDFILGITIALNL